MRTYSLVRTTIETKETLVLHSGLTKERSQELYKWYKNQLICHTQAPIELLSYVIGIVIEPK